MKHSYLYPDIPGLLLLASFPVPCTLCLGSFFSQESDLSKFSTAWDKGDSPWSEPPLAVASSWGCHQLTITWNEGSRHPRVKWDKTMRTLGGKLLTYVTIFPLSLSARSRPQSSRPWPLMAVGVYLSTCTRRLWSLEFQLWEVGGIVPSHSCPGWAWLSSPSPVFWSQRGDNTRFQAHPGWRSPWSKAVSGCSC